MRFALIVILFISCDRSIAQNTLEIDVFRFKTFKSTQLYTGSYLEYKLKGQHRFHIHKMVAMKDSSILFDNDSSIHLSQIKTIKLRNANHLYPLFGGFFVTGGVLFVTLDSFNNLINNQAKIVDERAVIAGASLVAAGLIIKQLAIKRVRIGKHKTLRILDINYQDLNVKK